MHDPSPKTDDFRIERDGDKLVLTFTPDGRSYTFSVDGDRLSEPSVSPAQANAATTWRTRSAGPPPSSPDWR